MNNDLEIEELMQNNQIYTQSSQSNFEDDDEEDLLVSQLNMDIANQFVVFSIENEEYGIPILSVQEIISLPNLTRIPGIPEYIPGIINLRGNIIPLYELRSKFKLNTRQLDHNSIVIIAQMGDKQKRTVGFIVDSVSDVVSITPEDLSESLDFTNSLETQFIDKIGKIGTRMIIIINLIDFLSDSEKEIIDKTVGI